MEYKKGDLVRLSEFGKLIAGEKMYTTGVILEGPYDLSIKTGEKVTTYYIAYDILVGDEIMKRVPVDFFKRMIQNEKDTKRMEEVVERDSPEG